MSHTEDRTKALAAVPVLVGVIGFSGAGEGKGAQTLLPAGAEWKYIESYPGE